MSIQQLPKEVYDLIAAGEVVLAPVSVVKELVENALDADSSRIIVETVEGGTGRIRVADNGSGIAREDIKLAFAPHATSKLNSAEDLFHIETLGFRGEALASIAAVSSLVMMTKTTSDDTGTRAETEGGSAPLLTPAGVDTGTNIVVEQLFFNIPARKKHLGDSRAEGRKITEYLSKAAVSRPDVAIRMIADGTLVFATPGNGDRLAAIAAVYGSRTAENLIPLNADSDGLSLEGYISGVLGLRGNRKGQHFFVNGRPVANAAVETAVSRAYREFAEPGRFPVVFLFLRIDPGMVDVNVHPAKSEISFAETGKVSVFIEESIQHTLRSATSIPRLRTTASASPGKIFHFEPSKDIETEKYELHDTIVSTSGGSGEKIQSVDINHLLSSGKVDIYPYNEITTPNDSLHCVVDHKESRSTRYDEGIDTHLVEKSGRIFAENTDVHYSETFKIQSLQVLATLFATYILAIDGETFYIIDQHAAHERVHYERFLKAFSEREISMQLLLTPYLFTVPATLGDLTPYVSFFEKIGYEIDAFGANTWAARSFPAFIGQDEAEAFLLETLAALGNGDQDRDKRKGAAAETEMISAAGFERIMMRACKASVKANRALGGMEITALLDALSTCRNPYTCPHGRPVFLKLRREDIERMFKRS